MKISEFKYIEYNNFSVIGFIPNTGLITREEYNNGIKDTIVCHVIIIFVFTMEAGQRNKLIYNFSSLSLIQAANFLLSLIVIPYVVRKVGADGFGIIAVAQVVIYYLAAITDYGFNRTATRDIAIHQNNKEKISKIFYTILFIKLLICIISFVLLIFLLQIIPLFNNHFNLYLLAFSFVLGQVMLVNWFFQGMEKMQHMAFTGLFSRLLFVILVFIFIRKKEDTSLFIFFMGAANMIAGLVSIYLAIRLYKLKYIQPAWADIWQEIRNGWQVTITNLSMITCQYIGIVILRIFTNDTLVGYYSIAEKIYFAMKQMMEVFSQAIYPRVCLLVQQGREEVISFFRKIYVPFLMLVTFASSMVFMFSPQILYFFIGHQYDYSVFLLRVLCIAVVLVCLNIPSHLILFAADYKKSYLKIFSIGTLLNILANLLLARYFDATGTVASVIITELFISAGLFREVYRHYFLKEEPMKIES